MKLNCIVQIIDDHADTTIELAELLSGSGYSVIAETDPIKGLAEFQRRTDIDVIVTDLRMPGMNGIEFAFKIRETNPDIPIIFISGNAEKDHVVAALRLRAIEFLEKPVDTNQLLGVVEKSAQISLGNRSKAASSAKARMDTRILHHKVVCAEREIQFLNHKIKSLADIKKNFMRNVNHELRTPLNAVIGALDILIDDCNYNSPTTRQFTEMAYEHAKILHRMLEELLELAGQGTMEKLKLTACRPREVVEMAVRACRLLAAEKGNIVHIIDRSDKTALLLADTMRAARAIEDILNNAIKFSPPGSRTTIEIHSYEKVVTIDIQDTGKGMTQDQLDEIRVDAPEIIIPADPFTNGVGIGLPFSKKLMIDQGGLLNIESTLNAGTTVRLTFRRYSESEDFAHENFHERG
jgi:signal transduction histidine kinase